MLHDLAAILALAIACAAWVAVQRFVGAHDPGNPGLDRSCDGSCSSCERSCDDRRR
jgi:hypothetical protein